MIKNDKWIAEMAAQGMIAPFVPELVSAEKNLLEPAEKVISYGTSSYGYDVRLSSEDFRVFRHIPGTVVDPKNFNPENLERVELHDDESGYYFIIPAHSYALGVSLERIVMPCNVTALCVGKSTYARLGIVANITPLEAGWAGHITFEFSNSSVADCRMYVDEGVVQLLFFEGEPCAVSYAARAGKYQDQGEEVTLARV